MKKGKADNWKAVGGRDSRFNRLMWVAIKAAAIPNGFHYLPVCGNVGDGAGGIPKGI